MDFLRCAASLSVFLLLPLVPITLFSQSSFRGFTLPKNTQGKQNWDAFKRDFVTSDGRVIDTANGGISHSEGQGYGMLIAASNRDLSTFSKIWSWTEKNLGVRDDGLFAWKWDPTRKPNPISDLNNATDGDLLIAWALQRGGELWRNEQLVEEARTIARKVRQSMIVESSYGPLLLPGADGFTKPDGIIVNLSYWVFPALLDLRRIDPSYVWDSLFLSGTRLMADARFGKWNLPPDWLFVSHSGELSLPDEFTPLFGYNAVRIPLYLDWAGDSQANLFQPFIDWATHVPNIHQLPDQVNLVTNEPGDYTVIPGMVAVYYLIAPNNVAAPPTVAREYTSYYSACLRLLSDMAARESQKYSSLPRP